MPLSVYTSGNEKYDVLEMIGESEPSVKKVKSGQSSKQSSQQSRKARWTYNIKQYQNHISQQYKTSASTGVCVSIFVIFIVQFFTL
jgi:hypothetical protein